MHLSQSQPHHRPSQGKQKCHFTPGSSRGLYYEADISTCLEAQDDVAASGDATRVDGGRGRHHGAPAPPQPGSARGAKPQVTQGTEESDNPFVPTLVFPAASLGTPPRRHKARHVVGNVAGQSTAMGPVRRPGQDPAADHSGPAIGRWFWR